MSRKKKPAASALAPVQNLDLDLRPGQSIELLKELHILTREGRINQDSRRKLKQIHHLMQFIEPILDELAEQRHELSIVDHGAGKSYLGFLIHDLYLRNHPAPSQIHSIERRAELVTRSQALAARSGFEHMHFHALNVADALTSPALPQQPALVTALHACNTATDDAIDYALAKKSAAMVLIPCCQAEVAAELRRDKATALARSAIAELWRHPIHTREFGSHITNVLRCLRLEAHGYQITVTELVGWEHSLKNELIIARRQETQKPAARQRQAALRLEEILQQLGLETLRERFHTPPM